MTEDWRIYRGGTARVEESRIASWLSDPPNWRVLAPPAVATERGAPCDPAVEDRGRRYVSSGEQEVLCVNMALLLRRPLLVTGHPGIGKSTLAYRIAWELGLGTPLRWEIGSRTTLAEGLYHYDALQHLQDWQQGGKRPVGDFITLGPLGTALLPTSRPRVLLVDELDKAHIDLPNDLLHVFEEAHFSIPELAREESDQWVFPRDWRNASDRVLIRNGRVSPQYHPVVIVTSNDERPFPPAFLRRCVSLDLPRPGREHLDAIVRQQLGADAVDSVEILRSFAGETTDRVLQALYLHLRHGLPLQALDPLRER